MSSALARADQMTRDRGTETAADLQTMALGARVFGSAISFTLSVGGRAETHVSPHRSTQRFLSLARDIPRRTWPKWHLVALGVWFIRDLHAVRITRFRITRFCPDAGWPAHLILDSGKPVRGRATPRHASLAVRMVSPLPSCCLWLRTNGVNTNGAAAKVVNFERLGKR